MTESADLIAAARECAAAQLPPARTLAVARQIAALGDTPELRTLRFAVLATSNLDFLAPALQVAAAADGIRLDCWTAGFNQIDHQVLDPGSALYSNAPRIALLAARAEDIVPALAYNLERMADDQVDAWVDHIGTKLDMWCAKLAEAGIQVLLCNFARPAAAPLGSRDFAHPRGQARTWQRLNDKVAAAATKHAGVFPVDIDGVIRRVGFTIWEDPKLWSLAKIAGGTRAVAQLADELLPPIREAAGRRRKCLVLDLDNTMWGGIIGEDGFEGIRLGGDFPGNVHAEFQKRVLDLWQQGVLLAINSKNNPADAEGAIEKHPEMQLRLEHFAARRINWQDKAQNLRELAKELNIGLDSLVFVDDNPVECERVRTALPQVTVFQVPEDISRLPREFARVARLFDGATQSKEDLQRNEMYRQNQLREAERGAAASVDDFLASLEMRAEVEAINKGNLSRVTQLLHKTNQFNVTTRRHSEQFLASLAGATDWRSYVVRLKDKYGDNGIVLVALVRTAETEAVIDTFLMSCRVIGRTLERTVLELMLEDLREAGVEVLTAEYIRTAKNDLVANLFPELGFVEAGSSDVGKLYSLPTRTAGGALPRFIAVERLA